MWFIFKPSERELAMEQSGLNDMVPQASVDQLEENKLKAYELSSYEESVEEQRKEIGRLSDYFVQEDTSLYPLKGQREDSASTSEAWGGDIAGSVQQYERNNQLLASFNEAENYYEEEIDHLRGEIESLREELNNR